MIAFIPGIVNDDWTYITIKLIIVGAAWLMVLMAMSIDLIFGIKKAKATGEYITSEGYRRSIHKFVYYYITLLFALIFDCILSIVTYYLPFPLSVAPLVTLGAALGLILTEWKSVNEKANEKLRRRINSSYKDLAEILKDKDLLSKIFEHLAKEKEKQDDTMGAELNKKTNTNA